MGISKIVIGYDPSDRARRALDTGVELATALDAEVHLVTAFDDGPSGGVVITPERQRAEQRLAAATAGIPRPKATVHEHAIPGRAADVIVRVATEKEADIIVIGNRGAQGPGRVLGSIASAVVSHAPCHVLVVKTTP